MRGVTRLAFIVLCALAPLAASAQQPAPKPQDSDLQALIRKNNAYIGLMNRTLRAVDSWNRYTSWVNVKTGPTGRERIIYGLYSLYDVRDEIAKAKAAAEQPPSLPSLDAAMNRYIDAYNNLAPLIARAEGYYERKDYMADKMAEGKEIHAKMAPAAETFIVARGELDREMAAIKADLDRRELADIEARDGKRARWHVRNVMIYARQMVDLLPTNANPVVDLPVFDKALAAYSAAVKGMDEYSQANPNQFFVFESQPRSYLGKLREFRQKLDRSKGDARRANVSNDLTWLVNDYNMMISSASSATTFNK
ncbi:YiiG family protein [Terrarubrum flagellatum]|uniref:YiiG family protein n=1 Tax=Terrirubrum flagellatum TaxID=2895980 RepID=UPI003145653A